MNKTDAIIKLAEKWGHTTWNEITKQIDVSDKFISDLNSLFNELMPTITDEEIKQHFTTTHKSWKEEPYKKINYDRVTGAKWMREWFHNRIKEKSNDTHNLHL